MADLSGDALIAYGFKRLIEEIGELKGEIQILRSDLSQIALDTNKTALNTKETATALQNGYKKIDKIEHDLFMQNDALMRSVTSLEKIQANTFTAEMNCIRLANDLRREDTDDMEQRLEGV